MNLNQEFNKLMKPLFVHAYRQAQKYGLKGDKYDLALEIRSIVFTKFLNKFENDIDGLKGLRSLEAYLKKSINNKASDLRDRQNHDPTLLREQKKEDKDGKIDDDLLHIQDNYPTQDIQLSNRQLINVLMTKLDEESQNIWFCIADGLTSDEIATKLGINSNTVRTKLKRIRLRAISIRKKMNHENY